MSFPGLEITLLVFLIQYIQVFPNRCDFWSLIVSCSSSVSLQGFQWRRMRRISTRLLKLVCSLSSTRSKVNRRDLSTSLRRKSRALPVSESFSPVPYVKHHMCFQRILQSAQTESAGFVWETRLSLYWVNKTNAVHSMSHIYTKTKHKEKLFCL